MIRKFLNLIGSKLREKRPPIPDTHNYTLKQYGDFVHFWFRTQGCKYTKNGYGGCLMCDYSSSNKSLDKIVINYIKEGLSKIDKNSNLILINSSGSFFDEDEVSKDVRIEIYNQLNNYPNLSIIFETLLETINEKKLIELKNILKTQNIDIEFGIENLNKLNLKYCINKNINLNSLENKIKLFKKYTINPVANVLVGLPFLSEYENIESSIKTINQLFDKNIAYVVLFPINIKPYTVVSWLSDNGYYRPISLWSYIEILNKIDKKYLNKIELSWYKDTTKNPIYLNGVTAPTTCNKCQKDVLKLLDKYTISSNRIEILNQLNQIECDCKTKWQEGLTKTNNFKQNILNSYKNMAIDILGLEYWNKNKNSIIKEIENDFR